MTLPDVSAIHGPPHATTQEDPTEAENNEKRIGRNHKEQSNLGKDWHKVAIEAKPHFLASSKPVDRVGHWREGF
jgi:hypothetical protein